MSVVKPDNYVVVQGWMLDLGLKGSELMIYAIIHGFSQDGANRFTGSLQYLADWTNTTRRSVMKCLERLCESGLLVKGERFQNGVKTCEYVTVGGGEKSSPGVKKVHRGGEQSSPGGGEKSSPNNIDSHKIEDKIEITPPTPSFDRIDYQAVLDMYNEICASLPKALRLSEARRKAIKARLNSYSMEDIKMAFEKAEASAFLRGSNGRDWNADFDWLMKDANLAKVLDGKYDDRPQTVWKPQTNRTAEQLDGFYQMAQQWAKEG